MADARGAELRGQLEQALALVAAEAPVQFAAFRGQLGGRAAMIRVGDAAALRLCVANDPPWVELMADGDAHVGAIELSLSEPTLSRLLRGQCSLEEAILDGTLSAKGELADLLAFFDALTSWLHGAFRSPSLPKLHQRCLTEKGPPPC